MSKRAPNEARRVSMSFDAADAEFMLHLLAAADLNDPERVKSLRMHPRSRSLLERFRNMHAKASGKKPRRAPRKRHERETVLAIMADIRATRAGRPTLGRGDREAIAARHGVTYLTIEHFVTLVNRADALTITAEAAE